MSMNNIIHQEMLHWMKHHHGRHPNQKRHLRTRSFEEGSKKEMSQGQQTLTEREKDLSKENNKEEEELRTQSPG